MQSSRLVRCLKLSLAILPALMTSALADDLNLPKLLKNGGLRVEAPDGRGILTYRDTESFIPASTLKVATSFCALEILGPDYHFTTETFQGQDGTLYIKGSGDPSLVSEELARMAAAIAPRMPVITKVVIDTSNFAKDLTIDGASASTNPYDARVGAFVGNFSTAFLTRGLDGSVKSAEPQTPLTPLARAAAARIKKGTTERINLGFEEKTGPLYGGELLIEFLRKKGSTGPMQLSLGTIPASASQLLAYRSSQPLKEIVRGLLKYSTNFTANQIFLTVGRARFGGEATIAKSKKAYTECLTQTVGWSNFTIEEGAGLSRKNRVSPRLMMKLLQGFEKYRELLPEEDGFQAKTGTLTGVNTLIGYMPHPTLGRLRFAILVNSEVPHLYKFQAARVIRDYLISNRNKFNS